MISRSPFRVGLIALALFSMVSTGQTNEVADSAKEEATNVQPEMTNQWGQWRGPNRDSKWQGRAWPETLNGKLEPVWKAPLDTSYSGPIVQGDKLFVTETINKASERVTAFNLSNGNVIWQKDWEGSIMVPFFAAANGSWIRSTPAVDGDTLSIVGIRDVLVSLDPKTGEEQWQVDFAKKIGSPRPAFGGVCSPLIDGDAIYVQTGGPTVKLNRKTGEILWKTLDDSAGGMMSAGAFSSPVIATIAGKRQLVVQTRNELCGVQLEDGEVMWRTKIQAFRGMNILTPTVIGDTIFTAAHSGTSQAYEVSQTDKGWYVRLVWDQNIQAYMSSPVVIDDVIYMHAKDQRFVAFDAVSGERLWKSKPQSKYESMIASGNQILSLGADGKLKLIKADGADTEIVDEMEVAEDSWAHLAVTDDYVLVRDLKAMNVYRWKR